MLFLPGGIVSLPGEDLAQLAARDRRTPSTAAEPSPRTKPCSPTHMSHPILTVEGREQDLRWLQGHHRISPSTLIEGELRTVIGPNGAGKTTFLDLITGRTKPDTGKIEFGIDASRI